MKKAKLKLALEREVIRKLSELSPNQLGEVVGARAAATLIDCTSGNPDVCNTSLRLSAGC